jgi:hypothetical protein
MTADPAASPLSLRSHLRDLQAVLDETAAAHYAHRLGHGCREGTCAEGKQLAGAVSEAQSALSVTRFLNEETDR